MTQNFYSEYSKESIASVFDELKGSIEISHEKIEKRTEKLRKELTNRFGLEIATSFANSFVKNTISPAVIGYLLNQPSIVYMQLCAIIERTAILILPQLITKDERISSIENMAITKVLDRMSIKSLTPILVELGIWNKCDETVIKNLCSKRNAIAHHNPKGVSKHFNRGIEIKTAKIVETVQKDKRTHMAIVDSIELLYKMVKQ